MQAGNWKHILRRKVWDILEETRIGQYPFPIVDRIPNFRGADVAGEKLCELPIFKQAKNIKVNRGLAHKAIRYWALKSGKTIVIPRPRMTHGFLEILNESHITENTSIFEACSIDGMKKFARPINLNEKLHVDLIVSGGVAVNRKNGLIVGEGKGDMDLEYGMLRWMGAVDDSVPIVTTLHDVQVVEPDDFGSPAVHDISADLIVTQTQVIEVKEKLEKPKGLYRELVSRHRLNKIQVLRLFKDEDIGLEGPGNIEGIFES